MSLIIYTIYDHPSDYPDQYVCRRFVIDDHGIAIDRKPLIVTRDLEHIRDYMKNLLLTCVPRADCDEGQIVEVWL